MARKKDRKASIFDLYHKEEKIKIRDDQGRFVEVLIRRLTQAQKSDVIMLFNKKLLEEKNRLLEDKISRQNMRDSLDIFDKAQVIQGIVEIERNARWAIADLLPVENEVELTQKQRQEKQDEAFKNWSAIRREELEREPVEKLRDTLAELRIGALATIQASVIYDYACIAYMCYNSVTNEPIFKDYKQVEDVLDRRIIEQLSNAIEPFRTMESDRDIRQLVEDDNFLSTGESGKSSADSQDMTK
jgi:hypothetical protein